MKTSNLESLEVFKEKLNSIEKNINDYVNKLIDENKGKSEEIKTNAYHNYKNYVVEQFNSILEELRTVDIKLEEANQIIENGQDDESVANAKKDLSYYTEKKEILGRLEENMIPLETRVMMELTFG
jgi:hypothetical protein